MKHPDSTPVTSPLPTLSVVIPAFNEQDVIGNCLGALYEQRGDIARVVVVDNNSTDDTALIVKEWMVRWPAVQVVPEATPGIVAARNAGLNAVQTDIAARIDADTIVSPGWAAAYRRFFAAPAQAAVGASTGIAVPHDLPYPGLTERIFKSFILFSNKLLTKDDTLFGTNMAIRREAWQAIRNDVCRKADIMEDMDIGLHLQRRGYRVRMAPDARVTFSGRRLLTSPWAFLRYNSMWPLTYWHHGCRLTAIMTWPLAILGWLLQTITWPIARSYDPATRRFSLRRLLTPIKTRAIPKGS